MATSITEFREPCSFCTKNRASGSAIHSPSTTNLYSYLPGGSASLVSQRPALCWIMADAPGSQSLNPPQTHTNEASGASRIKETSMVSGGLGGDGVRAWAGGCAFLGSDEAGFAPRAAELFVSVRATFLNTSGVAGGVGAAGFREVVGFGFATEVFSVFLDFLSIGFFGSNSIMSGSTVCRSGRNTALALIMPEHGCSHPGAM